MSLSYGSEYMADSDINMAEHIIFNLPNPELNNEPVTKEYADTPITQVVVVVERRETKEILDRKGQQDLKDRQDLKVLKEYRVYKD